MLGGNLIKIQIEPKNIVRAFLDGFLHYRLWLVFDPAHTQTIIQTRFEKWNVFLFITYTVRVTLIRPLLAYLR